MLNRGKMCDCSLIMSNMDTRSPPVMVGHVAYECPGFSAGNAHASSTSPSFTVDRILGHSVKKSETSSLVSCTQFRSGNASSSVGTTTNTPRVGAPQLPAWIYATRYSRQGLPRGYNVRRSQRQPREKKLRQIFSSEQIARLEKEFDDNRYVMTPKRKELASSLGLTETQIKTWFQNRRTKWRKEIRAEIIRDKSKEAAWTRSRPLRDTILGERFHDRGCLSTDLLNATWPTVPVAPYHR